MKILLSIIVAMLPFLAFANEKRCNFSKACPVGTKVITFASKDEPYYACPKKEYAGYVNFAVGAAIMHFSMTGRAPAISPATGEPQTNNDTQKVMDILRKNAGVERLGDAMSNCVAGENKITLKIINDSDPILAQVHHEKKNVSFWMPKASLDRKK